MSTRESVRNHRAESESLEAGRWNQKTEAITENKPDWGKAEEDLLELFGL